MAQLQVRSTTGEPLRRINIRLALNDRSSDEAYDDRFTDDWGNTAWPNPLPSPNGYTLYVNDRNVDARYGSLALFVRDLASDIPIWLSKAETAVSVPVLHRDGNDLRTPTGQIVRLEGATFFAAHWLLLELGRDAILPSIRQLRDRYGVNCLLPFGMSVNVQRNLFGAEAFDPSRYGNGFFDSLEELFSIFAEEGCYGYYPAFPDHGLIPAFASDGHCIAHWDRLLERFRRIPNVLLKPTNEGASKSYNYINPHLLQFPTFCPVAACDYGVDDPAYARGDWPAGADWGGDQTFGDLHPPREGTGTILDCTAVNNIYFKHRRGLAISEAIRLGSNGSGGVTRELARLVGLASRVGTLMRVFHSLQGEKCEVFDDVTRDHADAYFTGI